MDSSLPVNRGIPDESELWRVGDQYHYPLPRNDTDCWKSCLDTLLQEDLRECNEWKEEIMNQQLTAGVLSIIASIFLHGIQMPPSAQSHQTLDRLLPHLTNSPNGSTMVILPSSHIEEFTLRMTVYWSLSLTLSISSLLIGVVVRQWLREYQHYDKSISSKRTFAQRNMRFQSLESWNVPRIINAPHILLQGASILSIIGLIELAFNQRPVVAIPVVVAGSLTATFLLYTTIAAALQDTWFQLDYHTKPDRQNPPTPCPYKSPLSWTFLYFVRLPLVRQVWNTSLGTLHGIVDAFKVVKPIRSGSSRTPKTFLPTSLSQQPVPAYQSWNDFDESWVRRRGLRTSEGMPIDYDAAQGIATIVNHHSNSDDLTFAAYYCFRDLHTKGHISNNTLDGMSRVPSGPFACFGDQFPSNGVQEGYCIQDQSLMMFLNSVSHALSSERAHQLVRQHQVELLSRLYASHLRSTASQLSHTPPNIPSPFRYWIMPDFVTHDGYPTGTLHLKLDEAAELQVVSIWKSVVRFAVEDNDRACPNGISLSAFIKFIAIITLHARPITPELNDAASIISTITTCSEMMCARMELEPHAGLPFAFYLAKAYVAILEQLMMDPFGHPIRYPWPFLQSFKLVNSAVQLTSAVLSAIKLHYSPEYEPDAMRCRRLLAHLCGSEGSILDSHTMPPSDPPGPYSPTRRRFEELLDPMDKLNGLVPPAALRPPSTSHNMQSYYAQSSPVNYAIDAMGSDTLSITTSLNDTNLNSTYQEQ